MNSTKQYDAMIIGGGIAGLTLAAKLLKANRTVAMIESKALQYTFDPQQYDMRVSAITRASQKIFSDIGVWSDIVALRISRFQSMEVWDSTGLGYIRFSAQQVLQPELGYIIENKIIQHVLLSFCLQFDQFNYYCPKQASAINTDENHAELTLLDGKKLFGAVIVGADGVNSWCRQSINIDQISRSYEQTAIVTTVRTEKPHGKIARQCFTPHGPLAFLPLASPELCSIVWSVETNEAKRLMRLDKQLFEQALELAFDAKLGKTTLLESPIYFPLYMRHVKTYIKQRCVLIGDAAHTIHPLAGQGLNLGILDASVLSEILINSVNRDLGYQRSLAKYQRWRRGHNQGMIYLMDGFKHLFTATSAPIRTLRNIGLSAADRLPWLKNLIIRKAMGI